MTSIHSNGNASHRRHRKLPWKDIAEIASAITAIATLIGVLIHLAR